MPLKVWTFLVIFIPKEIQRQKCEILLIYLVDSDEQASPRISI